MEVEKGLAKDREDDKRFRQSRDRHEGFQIGQYLNMPPMFFTRDRHPIWCNDMYRGCPVFIIASGSSFASIDTNLLQRPGVVTMGLNNSVKSFRPNLWCSVDNPQNFMKSIWLDPKIQKFVPICHSEKNLFDNERWEEIKTKVGDCPNVFYYSRNEHFRHEQYLFEDTINWGCHGEIECSCGYKGCRSVMLAAIRIVYLLGFRTVFLLGTDFKMDAKHKYHFEQERSKGSINNNNKTYKALDARFSALQPIFKQNNFNIFNCVEDSGLHAFPFMDYTEAVKYATQFLPEDCTKERSEGLYDRKANAEKVVKTRTIKTLESYIEGMNDE
jgi:hypothetical protein